MCQFSVITFKTFSCQIVFLYVHLFLNNYNMIIFPQFIKNERTIL